MGCLQLKIYDKEVIERLQDKTKSGVDHLSCKKNLFDIKKENNHPTPNNNAKQQNRRMKNYKEKW